VERLKDILSNLNVELLDPIVIEGYPQEKDLSLLEKLAEEIFHKHKEHKCMN
jgi:molybdopterin-guanine dinucleotide biosynthesis protein